MKKFRWLVAVILTAVTATGASAVTPGGTQIEAVVSATYSSGNGVSFSAISNTVVATVANVSSVVITPKENGCDPNADAYPVASNVTRTFILTNNSNITDSYAVTGSTTAGSVLSLSLSVPGQAPTPLANGASTPALAPGQAVQIALTIATTNVPIGTNIELTVQAHSTSSGSANGQAADTASQCAIAVAKASIGGPTGANTQIVKLVDRQNFETLVAGTSVTYSIAYENYGIAAQNAVFTDTFPQGVTPSLNSIAINGQAITSGIALNGQTLTVQLGTLASLTPYTLSVVGTIGASAALGSTYVNAAAIASSNSLAAVSTSASALVGTANVVYDGYVGGSEPVNGAQIALVNPTTNQPIALGGAGVQANPQNKNPFVTGPTGTYGFAPSAAQLNPTTYDLIVTAPGYRNRRISVALTPNASGTLYTAVLTALDGQPLAAAGGFSVVPGPLTFANIYGLFGNVPLFPVQVLTISKTVDRSIASGGDRLVYTLAFSNLSVSLGPATVVDTLPRGVAFAPGTALVDGMHETPVVAGRTLTWKFSALTSSHSITYAVVVLPDVTTGATLTNTATIAAAPINAPQMLVSASASVDTSIVAGLFDDHTIVTGRVFIDRAGDGWFHKGDAGVPNVRLFLEDCESVVTDANGRFSFPGVRPGMHVLRLDATTLPTSVVTYGEHSYDNRKSDRRLLHGVFDGGVIEDIDFALEARS